MRRKVVAMLVVVLAISVLAGACAGDPASKTGQGPLDGRSWVLYAYHKTKPIPGTEITATFADGQVTGSAGCNSYFGAYELRGDSITVGLVGSTEMACVGPEGVMDQEQEYLKFLSQARTFRLSDDQLYIYWDDHDALTFEPQ